MSMHAFQRIHSHVLIPSGIKKPVRKCTCQPISRGPTPSQSTCLPLPLLPEPFPSQTRSLINTDPATRNSQWLKGKLIEDMEMEKENQENSCTCITDLSFNDNSSTFSECNSDKSGEFTSSSAESRRMMLIACETDDSDGLIDKLVSDLNSCSIDEAKQAALGIRLIAKNKPENRLKIAKAGAIKPLVSLISSSDAQLQEYSVTAILNLSLCDENQGHIVSSGGIKQLVWALRTGTATAKGNAASALLRLSQAEESKVAIGRSGAIPLLVNLLETGGFQGKKDALTALYSLCSVKENKIRAVQAGIMKPLVELMADFESKMVDKSAIVLSLLVSIPEAMEALVAEAGIPVLVEIIEDGSPTQKKVAVAILLVICEHNLVYRDMAAREGAIPALVALSQSGTHRAKLKAETLIGLLRQPRSGDPTG